MPEVGGIAVSPDGDSVAIIEHGRVEDGKLIGDSYSFEVIDLRTKAIIRKIRWSDPFGLSALMFSFAGEANIVIEERGELTGDQRASEGNPTLHFWDIRSGSEVQIIRDLGQFGHGVNEIKFYGVSRDGRTVLAYTGKSHRCNSCNKGTGQVKVNEARFSLLDRESGKVIAVSPSLKVIHHGCPILMISIATCDSFDEIPKFEMSQSGNSVAVSWATGGEPAKVYTLEPLASAH